MVIKNDEFKLTSSIISNYDWQYIYINHTNKDEIGMLIHKDKIDSLIDVLQKLKLEL